QEHKTTCLETQCFMAQLHAEKAFAHRAGFCETESRLDLLRSKGQLRLCLVLPRYLLPATQDFDPYRAGAPLSPSPGYQNGCSSFRHSRIRASRSSHCALATCSQPTPPRASAEKAAYNPAVTRASSG